MAAALAQAGPVPSTHAALSAPRAVYVAKVNANFPGNPARGLPTIQGVADTARLDPALVAASRCFVDSLEQALSCGELHHAVAAGATTPGAVAGTLDELVTGAVAGRRADDEITLFDSTGIALEDAAAALAAFSRWRVAPVAHSPV